MDLQILWFLLVAFFWAGYFLLEGFDFGVGMLLPFLPRDEGERRTMFESIGPVWDGNEVWLVVAGGATFAAFPDWYASMFSGFYIAFLLVLVFLIVRVISFEWRSKSTTPRWRTVWTWANTIGSFGASLIWGVGLSALLYGTPLDSNGDFTGTFWDLFNRVHGRRRPRGRAPVRLPRRDVPHAPHDAATCASARSRTARQLSIPAAALARGLPRRDGASSRTTGTTRTSSRRSCPAVLGIAALVLAVVFVLRGRARLGVRDDRARRDARRRDALHEPLPARDGLEPELRQQPHRRERLVGALHARGDDRRRADRGADRRSCTRRWTYRVFRQRLGGDRGPDEAAAAELPAA